MRWLRIGFVLAVVAVAGAAGAWGVVWFTLLRDLPEIESVADYEPRLTSQVFDRDGQLVGEFFRERRRLTPLEEIPRHVVLAFVAAEDGHFFEHRGVDYGSILRAAWVNLLAGGEIKQGGSTITQQTVKSLLLTPERNLQRKIKELILARRIEQQLTKDEILFLYLNQIYFGHGAYGIGEAAWAYFGKPASELGVSEAALLAGLPQRPSAYSPTTNPEAADARRRYVLRRMFEEGFIDEPTHAAALEDVPVLSPVPERVAENIEAAAYFTEEVRRLLVERLGNDLVLEGGLRIETTLDADLQRTATQALRDGLQALDRRQGWRGPLRHVAPAAIAATLQELAQENGLDSADATAAVTPGKPLVGVVTEVDTKADRARVAFAPGYTAQVQLQDVSWAREPDPSRSPSAVRSIDRILQVGTVARFETLADSEKKSQTGLRAGLYQEPLVQGAVLTLQVPDGDVLAMVGGYDFGASQFNRAVQARRQPGSAFKPIIYGAALHEGWTPTSIVVDRPVVYSDPESGFTWRPENYGRRFLGSLLLREALARSVNNATIHLTREVGVGDVVDYARRLGIESPLERNLSIALGSSSVSLLELTRAYATFPAGGQRVLPHFIRRVLDREGRVLLENVPLVSTDEPATAEAAPPVRQPVEGDRLAVSAGAPEELAIPETEAFLMTDLLRAVVVDPHGTGRRARVLGRSVGGKTGTTNEQADAWFVGFSPDVATGVWVGFDRKRVLGRGETGARAALPVWIDTMGAALSTRPRRDFPVPSGIVFARVDRKTGFLADADTTDPYFQAYIEGTEPTETADRSLAVSEGNELLRIDSF